MKRIILLILINSILIGCAPRFRVIGGPASVDQGSPTSDLVVSTQSIGSIETPQILTSNGLEIYFIDPTILVGKDYSGGVDKYLVQAIDAARISVDMAIYSINLWSIRDSIINAYQRGVKIRMVMESENLEDEVPRELRSAGITILGDRREGLMHNKFVIIDRHDVWTGSANMTIGSFFYDNNNLVHIHSDDVADDYLTEFDEMFVKDMFGSDSIGATPHPQVMVGADLVEIYFSPDDGVSEHILKLINSASKSIYLMAYSFTSDELGSAIIRKAGEGIAVEGVMDDGQIISNTGTEFDNFSQAGIKIYRAGVNGLMHNKVIIIDGNIVITGSYNFSSSAEVTNDENVLVIHSQEIAEKYLREYQRIISNLKN